MCCNAAGDTKRFTFLKLLAHLRDRAANIKAGAERFDAFRAQRLEFFSSEREQLVFVFHIRTANVRRETRFATLNRSHTQGVRTSKPSSFHGCRSRGSLVTSKPTHYVCQRNN